ncbi:hypothetical protein [Rhizobium sp. SSA_523]|uniref:hypothetical protein n=1 Tax=Rhizobium sp. SSA_523 TaxID=2952477 RepID=UPI002091D5BC|nr:hypothetical protein [Rhizobium sp. SSA_523]MCO5731739.1 hypothetical protein [Rhizobium sp. SSA_523]WKC22889.1 hypothetical protein QTJ18_18840 [Rhizobium sp. SSA_523]
MRHQPDPNGKPGETSQWPRWEGPAENRPSGYVQGEADIFADDPIGEKKRRANDYPTQDPPNREDDDGR